MKSVTDLSPRFTVRQIFASPAEEITNTSLVHTLPENLSGSKEMEELVKEVEEKTFLKLLCSVRFKSLIVIGSLLLMLFFVYMVVMLGVFPHSFVQIEQQEAQQGMARIMSALYDECVYMRNLLANNAGTQFSVDFLLEPGGPNPVTFEEDNYPFPNILGMDINYVGYYFLNGTIIFNASWNLNTQTRITYPPQLVTLIPGVTPIAMNVSDPNYFAAGFLISEGNVVMVVASPIYNGSDTTYGITVFAKNLDLTYVQSLATKCQLCVTFFPYNATDTSSPVTIEYGPLVNPLKPTIMSTNNGNWPIDMNSPVIIFDGKLSENRECWSGQQTAPGNISVGARVMNIVPIQDMFGQTTILVRLDMLRTTVLDGITAIVIAVLLLAFILFCVIVGVLLFIELFILRKVAKLQKEVTKITIDQDMRMRVMKNESADELGTLTRCINMLLDSIELSAINKKSVLNRMGINEQRSRAIMDGFADFIICCTIDGVIQMANSSFLECFSLHKSDVEGKLSLLSMLRGITFDDLQTLSESKEYLPSVDGFLEGSKKMIPVTILASEIRIDVSEQVVKAYVIVARNNTEQKSLMQRLEEQRKKTESLRIAEDFQIMLRKFIEKERFFEYCKDRKEGCIITFLTDVQQYRAEHDINSRIRMQKEIMEKYLTPDSNNYLTIETKLVEKEYEIIKKGYAQVDLFMALETAVRKHAITLYSSFIKQYAVSPRESNDTPLLHSQ
jgi:sensor domain CHASE-containing protein